MSFLRVYSNNMTPLAELDNITSLVFTKKYFTPGTWEAALPYRDDIVSILKKGVYFLINNDCNKVGLIGKVEINESKVSEVNLSGKTLSGVLSQRIVLPNQGDNFFRVDNKNLESIMYEMVKSQCISPWDVRRKLSLMVLGENKGRGSVTNWRGTFNSYLSEILTDIGIYGGLGYDVFFDIPNKRWVFNVLEGRNLTVNQNVYPNVVFSRELDNIGQIVYEKNFNNYKNSIYALMGDIETKNFNYNVSRDEGVIGMDIRECYLNASALAENMVELAKNGEKHKKENEIIETLEGNILDTSSFKYDKDWFVGDIVTVIHQKAGKVLNERITEVTEIYDKSGVNLEAVFGMDRTNLATKIENIERKVR